MAAWNDSKNIWQSTLWLNYEYACKPDSTPDQWICGEDIVPFCNAIVPEYYEPFDAEQEDEHKHDIDVLEYGFRGQGRLTLLLLLDHQHLGLLWHGMNNKINKIFLLVVIS